MSLLVLASKSASRQDMLRAAGVLFEPCPADVDERALEAKLGDCSAAEVASALAMEKARHRRHCMDCASRWWWG